MEKLVRVVNRGGGLRYSLLSDTVTHLVMGSKDTKVLDKAKLLDEE